MFRRRFTEAAARDVGREVPAAAAAACATGPSPVTELIREDENQLFAARLARLPKDFRQVIVLRVEHDLTFAAIGERIGRTEEASRKLFSRALDRLRGVTDSSEE